MVAMASLCTMPSKEATKVLPSMSMENTYAPPTMSWPGQAAMAQETTVDSKTIADLTVTMETNTPRP